jgi:adenosine/AMP kinase
MSLKLAPDEAGLNVQTPVAPTKVFPFNVSAEFWQISIVVEVTAALECTITVVVADVAEHAPVAGVTVHVNV